MGWRYYSQSGSRVGDNMGNDIMNDLIGMTTRVGPKRSAGTSLWLGIIGIILAVAGAFGSGQGFWPFGIGLLAVAAAFLFAVIGILTGLFAVMRNPSGSGLGRRIVIGLLLCGAVVAGVGPWVYRGFAYPPIHDVTTDIANPPEFSVIPSRKDNLAGVDSIDKWRALHRAAYADIAPITLAMTPEAAIARAKMLATNNGWVISSATPDRLEATATESPFKFKDDILVTATTAPDGKSTLVNMRSVSRVGASDFGINAKRIRDFLSALQK
jgi:uncharacterized protein (DUF1499 family)